jgi:hypothetical protein
MAAGRFVEVTDKEISEFEKKSVCKKTCVKIPKQLIICLRLGDHRGLKAYQ